MNSFSPRRFLHGVPSVLMGMFLPRRATANEKPEGVIIETLQTMGRVDFVMTMISSASASSDPFRPAATVALAIPVADIGATDAIPLRQNPETAPGMQRPQLHPDTLPLYSSAITYPSVTSGILPSTATWLAWSTVSLLRMDGAGRRQQFAGPGPGTPRYLERHAVPFHVGGIFNEP